MKASGENRIMRAIFIETTSVLIAGVSDFLAGPNHDNIFIDYKYAKRSNTDKKRIPGFKELDPCLVVDFI